jgi:HEAT repeat protein
LLSRYLRELTREILPLVLVFVDVVGVLALIFVTDIETRFWPWVWGVLIGVLAFGWANYRLYRRYAPGTTVGSAMSALMSFKREDRLQAVEDLADIGTEQALKGLRSALQNEYPDVRHRAARRLAEANNAEADVEDKLRELLRSDKAGRNDRIEAAGHLARLAPQAAVPDLIEVATGSDEEELQLAAINLLAQLKDDKAVSPLRLLVTTEVPVGEQAINALAKIGSPAAVNALATAYDEAQPGRPKSTSWSA